MITTKRGGTRETAGMVRVKNKGANGYEGKIRRRGESLNGLRTMRLKGMEV